MLKRIAVIALVFSAACNAGIKETVIDVDFDKANQDYKYSMSYHIRDPFNDFGFKEFDGVIKWFSVKFDKPDYYGSGDYREVLEGKNNKEFDSYNRYPVYYKSNIGHGLQSQLTKPEKDDSISFSWFDNEYVIYRFEYVFNEQKYNKAVKEKEETYIALRDYYPNTVTRKLDKSSYYYWEAVEKITFKVSDNKLEKLESTIQKGVEDIKVKNLIINIVIGSIYLLVLCVISYVLIRIIKSIPDVLSKLGSNVVDAANEAKKHRELDRIRKIAEETAIKEAVKQEVNSNPNELRDIKKLIGEALSKGDTESAERLTALAERLKNLD